MIVAFDDSSVDAVHINFRRHRRFFGMFAVEVDLAVEFRELSMRDSEELVDGETDDRA